MKCGVWTSIQVSSLSAGAGLLHPAIPASKVIAEADRAQKYRVGDITECVSQRLGECQVHRVAGPGPPGFGVLCIPGCFVMMGNRRPTGLGFFFPFFFSSGWYVRRRLPLPLP